MTQELSNLTLPDIKERKGVLIYLKIALAPILVFALALLCYFGYINHPLNPIILALLALILIAALLCVRHNGEFAYFIFEQQNLDFKKSLKTYIMRNLLAVGKEVKSNAGFDGFATTYLSTLRNENLASIAPLSFAMLGILGTFVSVAFFMPSFSGASLSAVEYDIAVFLKSISSAFYVAIYGIFLALWWLFFDKFGLAKIKRLVSRQKNSTSGFFWTKEELQQRYMSQGLAHFEKVGAIFEQASNKDFFAELDHSIERKFKLFQDMLNTEEKAVRLSGEHIKQTMNELSRSQRSHKDLAKVYADLGESVASFNHNLRDLSARLGEQYARLSELSNERIAHLDRTIATLDEKIESFKRSFGYYQDLMLSNQEKVFMGFKEALIQGVSEFKSVYEDEKLVNDGLARAGELKADMSELNDEASELIEKLNEK